jgi:hypothetical protein
MGLPPPSNFGSGAPLLLSTWHTKKHNNKLQPPPSNFGSRTPFLLLAWYLAHQTQQCIVANMYSAPTTPPQSNTVPLLEVVLQSLCHDAADMESVLLDPTVEYMEGELVSLDVCPGEDIDDVGIPTRTELSFVSDALDELCMELDVLPC